MAVQLLLTEEIARQGDKDGQRPIWNDTREWAKDRNRLAPDDDFRVTVAGDELDGSAFPSLDHPQVDPRLANAEPAQLERGEPRWQPGSIQREAILSRVGQKAQHARHQLKHHAGRPGLGGAGDRGPRGAEPGGAREAAEELGHTRAVEMLDGMEQASRQGEERFGEAVA